MATAIRARFVFAIMLFVPVGGLAENPDDPVLLKPIVEPASGVAIYASPSVRAAKVTREPLPAPQSIAPIEAEVAVPAAISPVPSPAPDPTPEMRLESIFRSGWGSSLIAEPEPASGGSATGRDAPAVSKEPNRTLSSPRRIVPARERLEWLVRALEEFDAGRMDRALWALEPLFDADPSDRLALTLKGAIFSSQKRFKEAAEVYRAHVAFHPLDAQGHFLLGVALQHLGRFREAADAYWTAMLLDPAMKQAEGNRSQIIASGILSQTTPEATR